ncbi:hypothetical protein EVAR_58108_1 [Eumeta japonica]|uniref:Uncharacterized protein n=1 Tax=Eumeta variegata TaxID=151549 RepID=A0A4C1YNW3_EUMVA|nr:hypothetical protein EVAR_58108_1 [Eumeta japonica]
MVRFEELKFVCKSLRTPQRCMWVYGYCSKTSKFIPRPIHFVRPGEIADLRVQYNARNSAAVKLATEASQGRKNGTREKRRKRRGALNLRITSIAGDSKRQSFFVVNILGRNRSPYGEGIDREIMAGRRERSRPPELSVTDRRIQPAHFRAASKLAMVRFYDSIL